MAPLLQLDHLQNYRLDVTYLSGSEPRGPLIARTVLVLLATGSGFRCVSSLHLSCLFRPGSTTIILVNLRFDRSHIQI